MTTREHRSIGATVKKVERMIAEAVHITRRLDTMNVDEATKPIAGNFHPFVG